jgi:hypothetical protein
MQRRTSDTTTPDAEWTFVTATNPCQICGACEGCRSGFEGQFACCMHQCSQWPLLPGGWLHRLEAQIADAFGDSYPDYVDDHRALAGT